MHTLKITLRRTGAVLVTCLVLAIFGAACGYVFSALAAPVMRLVLGAAPDPFIAAGVCAVAANLFAALLVCIAGLVRLRDRVRS
ncbi:MAG: hypothetical protein ABL308_12630 [Oceanicaulis sp.]